VDRLEAAGYVTRRRDPADRRAQIIAISDDHSQLRAEVWEPVVKRARSELDVLADAELEQLTRILQRLAEVNHDEARRIRPETEL
jgi:DNA-binding MarR family transcriptional regulator